jgi:hypothetical protein
MVTDGAAAPYEAFYLLNFRAVDSSINCNVVASSADDFNTSRNVAIDN